MNSITWNSLKIIGQLMSADHILKLVNPMWASHEARHHPLVKQICESNSCSETERTYLEVTIKIWVAGSRLCVMFK